MSGSIRAYLTAVVAGALVLGAAGCKKGEQTAERADTSMSQATGTVEQPAATLKVTDVELGRSMRGDTAIADETDDFKPAETIHAVVKHEGAAQGAQLTARWTYQDGQVVDERTETISPTGSQREYTHFMISKPSGWPKGKYTLHVLLNGQEVETKDFEVK
ncbi:MAG TPA: hypothetical protein VFS05_07520 [Gemmatimonadaceae bacterium]|nr:hypothetical protein [Gemmatimonadaceae bacterium]